MYVNIGLVVITKSVQKDGCLENLSLIMGVFGLVVTLLGILPFIFAYPYCDYCPNSGPKVLD
ncbi:hypothetical protein ACFFMO_05765 [Lederbergia wuyishanensis]